MARKSAETYHLLALNPEPSVLQETLYDVHKAESVTTLPVGAPDFGDPLQHPRGWKGHIKHWVSKPSVKVFITLVVITALSFFPATLSNAHDLDVINAKFSPNDDVVLLLGDIFNFQWGDTRKVSVAWSLTGWGKYRLQLPGYPLDSYLPVDRAVNVYLNNASDPVFSYNPGLLPTYASFGKLFVTSLSSFSMEHNMQFCNPQYYAPNDCYDFSAFAFIIEKDTNTSIPVTFSITNSGPGDFTVMSNGLPTRSNFTYIAGGQPTTAEIESYMMDAEITRSQRARALTYFMFAINWLLTLGSLVTTAFIFNRRGEVKDSVALLPITAILTIPAIRGIYVGSPPFGIFLDVVGFFPQMMSVAMCIVVVLAGFSLQYMRGKHGNTKGASV